MTVTHLHPKTYKYTDDICSECSYRGLINKNCMWEKNWNGLQPKVIKEITGETLMYCIA